MQKELKIAKIKVSNNDANLQRVLYAWHLC